MTSLMMTFVFKLWSNTCGGDIERSGALQGQYFGSLVMQRLAQAWLVMLRSVQPPDGRKHNDKSNAAEEYCNEKCCKDLWAHTRCRIKSTAVICVTLTHSASPGPQEAQVVTISGYAGHDLAVLIQNSCLPIS